MSRRNFPSPHTLAATNARNFRTFLLMEQFAAQEVGARIRQARKEANLTQEDLAHMGGFSARALQEWEAGVRIPYKHLRELGRLLGKPTEWFLYGDPEPVQPVTSEREVRLEQRLDQIEEQLAEVVRLLREREVRMLGDDPGRLSDQEAS